MHARNRLQDPSDQPRRKLPNAQARPLAVAHGGLGRRRHGDNAGQVLRARPSFTLLRAATQDRSQWRRPVSRDESTHTFRASELMSTDAHEVRIGCQRGNVEPAERLHGICVHESRGGALVH